MDEAKARLVAEVKRRRIRFNRAALPGEKGGAGKEDGKAEADMSGATAGTPADPAQDEAARAGHYFDRFFSTEAPILHRLGIVELV